MVYQILFDNKIIRKGGEFDNNDLPRVWHQSHYRDKHGELLQLQELKADLARFPEEVKKFYERQTKIFTIARDGQSKAEARLREAEKVLKSMEGRVRRCYGLQGQINNLNTEVANIIRGFEKEEKAFEDEVKPPRSDKNGFWIEDGDPIGEGVLRFYQRLKKVDGLSLPLLLSFEDFAASSTILLTKNEILSSLQRDILQTTIFAKKSKQTIDGAFIEFKRTRL